MLVSSLASEPTWLLLRTKPKQEGAVSSALASRGLEVYCPRVLEPRWHARAPRSPVPLFPSYVFARCVAREQFALVNYCTGASGVVRFGEWLGGVEEQFIAALRQREGECGYLEIGTARAHIRPGRRAVVVGGPLDGVEGLVTQYLPARDRVRLLLTIVSSSVRRVEVEGRYVRCA